MHLNLVHLAVGKTLSSSAVFLFLTVLLLAASRRVSTSIVLFALQSAIITAQVMATAYTEASTEAWVVAALVFTLKVVTIPSALLWLVKRLKASRGIKPAIGSGAAVFVAALMIFLSYLAVQPYARASRIPEDTLAAAVALILTGAFLMVSHRTALMQIVGLLVLENGIFLAALTTTFGMPLVIEIGVFFDLLMGILIMGVFAFRIRDTFEHLDVTRLRRLRG
ncbi:MAG TPA: hydrogenase [Terriglobia bacterium]|nr:hydrogenase [Terriglobia bacterium]